MPSNGPGTGARLATVYDSPLYDRVRLWIDAADTSTIGPGAGAAGSSFAIRDKSRFGCSLALTSGFHGRIVGNLPALDFHEAGGGSTAIAVTNGMPGNPTNRYLWCVFQTDEPGPATLQGQPMLENTGSDSPAWRIRSPDTTPNGQDLLESGIAHHVPTSQTSLVAGTTYILAMQYTPTVLTAYLNGAQDGAALSISYTFSGTGTSYTIGYIGFAGYALDGALCELIVIDENLTPRERAWYDNYAAAKWRRPLTTSASSPPLVFA